MNSSDLTIVRFRTKDISGFNLVSTKEWDDIYTKFSKLKKNDPFVINDAPDLHYTVEDICKSLTPSTDAKYINAFQILAGKYNCIGIDIFHEIKEYIALDLSEQNDANYSEEGINPEKFGIFDAPAKPDPVANLNSAFQKLHTNDNKPKVQTELNDPNRSSNKQPTKIHTT